MRKLSTESHVTDITLSKKEKIDAGLHGGGQASLFSKHISRAEGRFHPSPSVTFLI